MQFTMQLNVIAGRATLLHMPELAEGSSGVVTLAVSFDESWDAFSSRTAIFWREGEAVLRLPLDFENRIIIPSIFTQSDKPFLVRILGESGERKLHTNEICTQFRKLYSLDAKEPEYEVYVGSYTLTENKVYPMRDLLMANDVTVDVATIDTSKDTVTPQTLLPGITAHDADGKPIVGAYVNPYNANTAEDTVAADLLVLGITAHDSKGESIVGTVDLDSMQSESFSRGYMEGFGKGSELGVDTSADTVTPDVLLKGYTAHDANKNPITGTYTPPDLGFVNLVMSRTPLEGGTRIKEN